MPIRLAESSPIPTTSVAVQAIKGIRGLERLREELTVLKGLQKEKKMD